MHQSLKSLGLLGIALAMLLVAAAVPAAPAPRALAAPTVVPPVVALSALLDSAVRPAATVAARPEPAMATSLVPPRQALLSVAPSTDIAPPAPLPTRTLDDVLPRQAVSFHPLLRFAPEQAPAVPARLTSDPIDPTLSLQLPDGERVAVLGSSVPEPSLSVCNSWVRSDAAPSLVSLARATHQARTLELGMLAWTEPTLPDEFDPETLKAGIGVREDEEVEVRLGLYPKFPDDAYQVGDHMLDTEDFSQTRAFLRAAWDW